MPITTTNKEEQVIKTDDQLKCWQGNYGELLGSRRQHS